MTNKDFIKGYRGRPTSKWNVVTVIAGTTLAVLLNYLMTHRLYWFTVPLTFLAATAGMLIAVWTSNLASDLRELDARRQVERWETETKKRLAKERELRNQTHA